MNKKVLESKGLYYWERKSKAAIFVVVVLWITQSHRENRPQLDVIIRKAQNQTNERSFSLKQAKEARTKNGRNLFLQQLCHYKV